MLSLDLADTLAHLGDGDIGQHHAGQAAQDAEPHQGCVGHHHHGQGLLGGHTEEHH